jgi:hypothetical protein
MTLKITAHKGFYVFTSRCLAEALPLYSWPRLIYIFENSSWFSSYILITDHASKNFYFAWSIDSAETCLPCLSLATDVFFRSALSAFIHHVTLLWRHMTFRNYYTCILFVCMNQEIEIKHLEVSDLAVYAYALNIYVYHVRVFACLLACLCNLWNTSASRM